MRRAASLSRTLTAVMIPLCIWGIVSVLMLHLIAVRSVFVQGGEGRLRLAVLAFSAGVILLQRLIRTEGEAYARAYAWGIGVAMTLFALHNAFTYRLPVHPFLIFIFNLIIFGSLWWVAHTITAACSADTPEALASASESGSLKGFRFRLPGRRQVNDPQTLAQLAASEASDKRWEQKLPASHPGRVLLYFSLFAIPAFGLGVYLFEGGNPHRERLGILLFVYLWCILALLFLSSLSQIGHYFDSRGVTLPDTVGITWLSIGFALVTFVLLAAFFLPQPSTVSRSYVREKMITAYRGWESDARGFREASDDEGAPGSGERDGEGGMADSGAQTQSRGSGGGNEGEGGADRGGEGSERKERFETDREGDESTQADATSRKPERRSRSRRAQGETNAVFRFFEKTFVVVLWVGVAAGVIVLLALIAAMVRGMAGGLAEFRFRRKKKSRQEEKKPGKPRAPDSLRRFTDPFRGPGALQDGDELVRYLWRATLAWCSDYGTPCEAGQTPSEFLAREPEALKGFEEQARFIASMINFSEFSGSPIPESARPKLNAYWSALQKHAGLPG